MTPRFSCSRESRAILLYAPRSLKLFDRLQVFALEQHVVVKPPGQPRRYLQRRLDCDVVHPRSQDSAQIFLSGPLELCAWWQANAIR